MASTHATSDIQVTDVDPAENGVRPRSVYQPEKSVWPRHANHTENGKGLRYAHSPEDGEQPMEVDPPQDEEGVMENGSTCYRHDLALPSACLVFLPQHQEQDCIRTMPTPCLHHSVCPHL